MDSQSSLKRKKIFIQPNFQRKFILWVVLVMVLASILSATLLYFLLTSFYASQSQSAHIILLESWQHLGIAIVIGNLFSLLLGSAIVAYIVLHRSHKIAGPLYRFCRTFEQIGAGDLKDVMQLRKNDELSEVSSSIQQMIDGLKQQRQQRQQVLQEILHSLVELQQDEQVTEQSLIIIHQVQQQISHLLNKELN